MREEGRGELARFLRPGLSLTIPAHTAYFTGLFQDHTMLLWPRLTRGVTTIFLLGGGVRGFALKHWILPC